MRARAALLAVLLLAGCAGTAPQDGPRSPHVAVLPFENIGGGAEGARVVTLICQSLIVAEPDIRPVDPGAVEEALVRLRIRVPVLMTAAQRDSLRAALACDYALTGSVLSFGEVNHPHAGKVGLVSLTVQVMDLRSGKVAWARTDSRQGSDGQWLFGLGVQRDPALMANDMCHDILGKIPWRRLGH